MTEESRLMSEYMKHRQEIHGEYPPPDPLLDLAIEYAKVLEERDQRMLTGPIINGVRVAGSWFEQKLLNEMAGSLRREFMCRAYSMGTRQQLLDAWRDAQIIVRRDGIRPSGAT